MKLFNKLATKVFAVLFVVSLILPVVGGLNIPLFFPPSVSISADYDRTTTTAEIFVSATDIIDNAGMAWIDLYEDDVLIKEVSCSPSSSICFLTHVEVKTSAVGVYTYTAVASDTQGKIATDEIDVSFAGVDHEVPEYSNIVASPVSPAPYGTHSFSVDWTDNGRVDNVQIEHNFFGSMISADVANVAGNTYTYDAEFLDLDTYQWRMVATDVAEQNDGPNTNSTPWQTYAVVRATPTVNWSVTPGWTVDYGIETSVGCVLGESANIESQVELLRDGVVVLNPDVSTLDAGIYNYSCVAPQTAHYDAISYEQNLTVNQLPSDALLTLNGAAIDLPAVERFTDTVLIDGTLVTGENGLEIYIDGAKVANGTSPLSYSTEFNITGTYNITLVAPETINYSRYETTLFATVVDTVAPGPVTGLTASLVGEDYIHFNWTNPTDDDFADVRIYLDGTNVDNVTSENYSFTNLNYGTLYNITLTSFDNYGMAGTDAVLLQTTLPDTTAPNGTATPVSNFTFVPGYDFVLEAEWTDTFPLNIVSFEHDFTGTPAIQNADGNNSNVYFLNVSDLGAGVYQWRANADDASGNLGTTPWETFEIYKTEGQINLMLNGSNSDITIFEGSDVNITAELVGEDDIDIMEDGVSLYLSPAPQTIIQNYPLAGTYNVTVDYAETANYTADSETLFVNVVDIFPPATVSALSVTANGDNWTEWTWANPVDADFNESIIYLNGVNVANTSATSYNATNLVPESTNTILIHTVDNAGNVNTTDVNNTFQLPDLTNPVITVLAQPSDRAYDIATVDQFLVSVIDNRVIDTVQFEMDGVNQTVTANGNGLYEVNLTSVSAIQHFFSWHANDTEGNTVSTPMENYTVSKIPSGVNLTLNGAKQDITVVGTITGVNVTAEKLAGEGTIEVFENGVSIDGPGNGPYTQLRDYTILGDYNITVVYAETANYARSEETYWVKAQPIIRNVSLSYPGSQVIPNDANGTYTITVNNTGNVMDNFTLAVASFDSDVAVLNQTSIIDLAPGATVDVELDVADTTYGLYNATINAAVTSIPLIDFNLDIQTTVAAYSTVIDSTIVGIPYIGTHQTTSVAQLYEAHVEDSTITDVDTDINSSTVHSSTIDNSYILANSQINSSTVIGSILSNCIVINSVLEDISASNCYVEDSYGDPSDLSGSTVTGSSNIINSQFTNSNGTNAQVTDSFVDNSNVTDATITNSTFDNSNALNGAVITDSTVDGSTVDNSNVCDVTSTGSTITDTDICAGTALTVTNAVITNGTITAGTITYPDGTVYDAGASGDKNVSDIVNYAPVAGISTSSNPITVGGSITFTSTSTDVNNGTGLNDNITSYDWSIGGVSFGTNSSASYTFNSVDSYDVTLTVTDSFGASDNETVTITVNSASTGSSSGGSSGSRRSRSSSGPRVLELLSLKPGTFVTIDLFESDTVKFTFDETDYFILVKDVNVVPKQADLHIEPLSYDFMVEEYKVNNINLDGDMLNDISIKIDQYTSNTGAKFTFGMKAAPEYDPIYVPADPEPEPEPEPEPVVNETEDNETSTGPTGGVVIDVESTGLWSRFVSWIKNIFSGDDEVEPEPETESEVEDEEVEDEAEQKPGLLSRFISWSTSAPNADVVEGEESEDSLPRSVLGWSLAFLVLALGISLYLVVRKGVIEKRLEKYL